MPKEIHLATYVASLMEEAQSFQRLWIRERKKDKTKWPMKMAPGDWDEQFTAHLETVRKGDETYED